MVRITASALSLPAPALQTGPVRTVLSEVVAALTSEKTAARRPRPARGLVPHLHSYRFAGDSPVGGGSWYRCRCGEVRPGL